MPSVFTIQGTDGPKRRRRKKARRKSSGVACTIGECKPVYNPRTKRRLRLCCVGKAKSPTGWRFMKA